MLPIIVIWLMHIKTGDDAFGMGPFFYGTTGHRNHDIIAGE